MLVVQMMPRCLDSLLRIVVDLALGESEDLIHILQPIGVTRERKVDQGHTERGDVLNGEIRSGLSDVSK